jgi:hypothetical protein
MGIFIGISVVLLFVCIVLFIMMKHYKNKCAYWKFLYSELHGKIYEYRLPTNEDGVFKG